MKNKKPTTCETAPIPFRQQLNAVEKAQCDLWHNGKIQEAFAEAHGQMIKLNRIVDRIGAALENCATHLMILSDYKRQDREVVKSRGTRCKK